VRRYDVTRAAIQLDGVPAQGHADVTLSVRGQTSDMVRVRILDRRLGNYVYDQRLPVSEGFVKIENAPLGHWHFEVIDDTGATSCYDADSGDGSIFSRIPIRVEIDPTRRYVPDPPDPARDPFFGLPDRYRAVVDVLPQIGIQSLRELATVEGEGLMHRIRTTPALAGTEIPNPLIGAAILEARSHQGQAITAGARTIPLSLAEGGSYRRAFLPATTGSAELRLDLPADQTRRSHIDLGRRHHAPSHHRHRCDRIRSQVG
jgi:hypothetical protein